MNSFYFVLCTFGLVIHPSESVNLTTPELGTLVGSTGRTAWSSKIIYQFIGVRYAQSPNGENRFKPPVLAIPWPGIHYVQNPGKPCPVLKYIQNMSVEQLNGDLEDCLHLSIYTKNISGSSPVMLYIHGGGFEEGASDQHPPNYLLEQDIVLVVPQYRLGPLGFLSTQTSDIPGNAGLLDIFLAINWTKSYIGYFGGDANRLTIFGQSAGAALASALMISPLVPINLFQNVILQSGSVMSNWAVAKSPIQDAKDIAKFGDCPDTESIDAINSCLKRLPVVQLLKAYHKKGVYANLTFEGAHNKILPYSVEELARNYKLNKKNVTLVAGVTKHDGSFILATLYDKMVKNYGKNFNGNLLMKYLVSGAEISDLTGSFVGYVQKELFTQNDLISGNFTTMIPGLMDLCGVIFLKAPVLKIAQMHAEHYPAKTYLYSFDYIGQFTRFGYFEDTSHYPFSGGIHHSDDNIYLFPWPEFASKLNAEDTVFSKKMVNLWTSVSINNKPLSENHPQWPSVTKYSGPVMHINKVNTISDDFLDEFSVSAREARHNNQIKLISNTFLIASLVIFSHQIL